MLEKETNTNSAGSKPALNIIRVKDPEREKIKKTVTLLQSEFYRRAKVLKIPIVKRKQNRNVPGIPEAVECLLCEEWGDCSLENRVFWYVQTRIISKLQGVQA